MYESDSDQADKSRIYGVNLVLLVRVEFNTRVARILVSEHRASRSEALRVLVEEDIALVLNELALAEDAVHLSPARGTSDELDASLSQALAESVRCLPSVKPRSQ